MLTPPLQQHQIGLRTKIKEDREKRRMVADVILHLNFDKFSLGRLLKLSFANINEIQSHLSPHVKFKF